MYAHLIYMKFPIYDSILLCVFPVSLFSGVLLLVRIKAENVSRDPNDGILHDISVAHNFFRSTQLNKLTPRTVVQKLRPREKPFSWM